MNVLDCAKLISKKFAAWYYNYLNSEIRTAKYEDFFANTTFILKIIRDSNNDDRMDTVTEIMAENDKETAKILNFIKYGLKYKFSPANINYCVDVYGQIEIIIYGTVHERPGHKVVGLFSQTFLIINDPDPPVNNYKIFKSNVLLHIG